MNIFKTKFGNAQIHVHYNVDNDEYSIIFLSIEGEEFKINSVPIGSFRYEFNLNDTGQWECRLWESSINRSDSFQGWNKPNRTVSLTAKEKLRDTFKVMIPTLLTEELKVEAKVREILNKIERIEDELKDLLAEMSRLNEEKVNLVKSVSPIIKTHLINKLTPEMLNEIKNRLENDEIVDF